MYKDDEIRKILNRAAQLQNRVTSGGGVGEPLGLEEIEKIAQESGLSAEYVRQAVIEYEGVPVEEPFFIDTGNRNKVELLGFSRGTLDSKTWAELRSVIEFEFDTPGSVNRRPDGIIWRAKPVGIFKILTIRKSPEVEIRSSGRQSAVKVRQDLRTYRIADFPGYLAAVIAIGLAAIGLNEGAIEALMIGAIFGGLSYLLFRLSNKLREKVRRKLKETTEQLQSIINRRYTASRQFEERDSQHDNEKSVDISAEINDRQAEKEESDSEQSGSGRKKRDRAG